MKRQKRNAYHHVIVSASKIDSNMAMICFQCLVVQTVKCVFVEGPAVSPLPRLSRENNHLMLSTDRQ